MQIEKNKFEFIKKIRVKIQIGDCFCFKINHAYYSGVVIHNQLIEKYGENTMFTLLILNYKEKNINDISFEKLTAVLKNKDLLLPPININKLGWTKGFFLNIGNIDVNNIALEILDECRFFYDISTIYNICYDETTEVTNLSLVGRSGIYNHLGLESLLQISLDLEFSMPNEEWYNPYEYYDELKEIYSNLELPFWYYKAKKRLNK